MQNADADEAEKKESKTKTNNQNFEAKVKEYDEEHYHLGDGQEESEQGDDEEEETETKLNKQVDSATNNGVEWNNVEPVVANSNTQGLPPASQNQGWCLLHNINWDVVLTKNHYCVTIANEETETNRTQDRQHTT